MSQIFDSTDVTGGQVSICSNDDVGVGDGDLLVVQFLAFTNGIWKENDKT